MCVDFACSTGVVDQSLWLRIVKQDVSCASVAGRGIVFCHYYQSIAEGARREFCVGAVVPCE